MTYLLFPELHERLLEFKRTDVQDPMVSAYCNASNIKWGPTCRLIIPLPTYQLFGVFPKGGELFALADEAHLAQAVRECPDTPRFESPKYEPPKKLGKSALDDLLSGL